VEGLGMTGPAANRPQHDSLGRSTMQTTTEPAEDLELDEDAEPDEVEPDDTEPPTAAGAGETTAPPDEGDPETPISYEITPSAVTGIIRGLASTIPPQGTMLLAIAKPAADEVLVTIVPARAEKETDSAIPLVVRGTAEEIDLQLVEALSHYVPARTIALRSAQQIARDTATAAKSAAEAAKARTTASAAKTKTPSLTVTLEPTDATLRVVNGADAVVDVKPGVKTTLSKGRYIATVSKLGYNTKIQNVVVGEGPHAITITLEQSDQVALFGGTPT
jgi:PRTRC genetic system protein E